MNLPDTWNALNWLPPLAVIAILALLVILWSNGSHRVSLAIRIVLTLLKITAIALLCLCLLEPMHSFSRPEPGANTIVVMADSSQSLNIKDRDADETRAEQLAKVLAGESEWLTIFDKQFELRRYKFDTRVDAVTDYEDFAPDGVGSAITGSLHAISERLRDKPSAGIILLTDGNSSESLAARNAINYDNLPPIFPVVIGSDQPTRDISITSVETSQTNFESAPVTIKTELVAHGHAGDTVNVELLGKDNESIEIQEVRHIEDGRAFAVRFQLKPKDRGVNLFRVRAYTGDAPTTVVAASSVPSSSSLKPADSNQTVVTPKPQREATDELTKRGEATLANNERSVVVDRGRGPFRVLYVAGRPNWEYKFLRRAISDDDELNMIGLLRVARKEPKFSFRGHKDESTNPLYRGFGNQADATAEQYDEPVLIRLDTRDETELRDGFPKDAKTLFEYDAIILDDLEAKFFTQDQQTLISQFVNLRGGGLLMLGGMDSFASGGFDRTRIGEMLPIYLDQRQPGTEDIEYKLDLTREGWIQPWMRMASTRAEDEKRIEDMPPFRTLNRTRSIKPGASVLAHVQSTDGQTYPALAVQRFGKGRSAAMLIGDLWRWKLKSPKDNDDLYKSWRQTLRWLVSDVPRRVEVKVAENGGGADSTSNLANITTSPIGKSTIEVQAYGEEFKPQLNSTVELTVTTPSGKEIQLSAEQDTRRAGNYLSTFISREPGAYRVSATVRTPEGDVVEERQSGWVSDVTADEFETLVPNRKWLGEIAGKTGGEVIELADLDEFARAFENRKVPQIETRIEPWWHRWWVFATAMGLLVTEWGIRRMAGLA